MAGYEKLNGNDEAHDDGHTEGYDLRSSLELLRQEIRSLTSAVEALKENSAKKSGSDNNIFWKEDDPLWRMILGGVLAGMVFSVATIIAVILGILLGSKVLVPLLEWILKKA